MDKKDIEILKSADRSVDMAAASLARIISHLPADIVDDLQPDIDFIIAYMAAGAELIARLADLSEETKRKR